MKRDPRGMKRSHLSAVAVTIILFVLYFNLSWTGSNEPTEVPMTVGTRRPRPTRHRDAATEATEDAPEPGVTAPVPHDTNDHHHHPRPASRFPTVFDPNRTEVPENDDIIDGVKYDVPLRGFVSKVQWQGKCWYRAENFCVIQGRLTLFHDPAEHGTNPTKGSLRMCNEFSQHSELIKLRYHSYPAFPNMTLPAPLLTKTPGWVLQYWCQDLFHMTLGMLPAYHTRPVMEKMWREYLAAHPFSSNKDDAVEGGGEGDLPFHPDIYLHIAKGKRKRSAFCRIKFGHPQNYSIVRNEKWGDHQFPFPGNPYWPFYQVLSKDPWRLHPLYAGATKKSACYRFGAIDKFYVKDMNGEQARQYSNALLGVLKVEDGSSGVKSPPLSAMPVVKKADAEEGETVAVAADIKKDAGGDDVDAVPGGGPRNGLLTNHREVAGDGNIAENAEPNGDVHRAIASNPTAPVAANTHGRKGPRRCDQYRVTIIDRRGKTRRLNNIPELVATSRELGFLTQSVALETIPIVDQIALMRNTDVLVGVHGNGITWLQFLVPGSVVIELVGIWYQPYSKLWGHLHLHSSMKNNMEYKMNGEFKPFSHNVTEVRDLLIQAKAHLDQTTSCGGEPPFRPGNERLEMLYGGCAPHC